MGFIANDGLEWIKGGGDGGRFERWLAGDAQRRANWRKWTFSEIFSEMNSRKRRGIGRGRTMRDWGGRYVGGLRLLEDRADD